MMKIAIIDDDSIVQFIARRLICKISDNNQILQFTDGQHALDFIASNQDKTEILPDLILLDINMPRLNGWEFLDSLRDMNHGNYNPKIYIASSSTDPKDIQRSTAYDEVQGYLVKPFSQRMVEDIIAQTQSEYIPDVKKIHSEYKIQNPASRWSL